ncbi:D-methionine transport system ATP-binding protein [Clostridium cavendishii DSM 21758]|uniref:D-methionine transport system ATP-binding protein n=1 Tax=Clostridium cavendishii DSM 21758 TaxID=1121302 RepID=A0A1M6BGG4_9CLOT|nr:methionine ABC transporter ATP-binding protein [Clostridium cavendishii]SHI47799.1 D-methionine transport system ATP-binding protein [Clostridium cavendishii DSM 21758]
MIEIRNVYKSFNKVEVLKDVSINIEQGQIYGIIGHSGAGKSTLLRCINGLEGYEKGSVKVMGKEVKGLRGKELREFRKDLGMIFQSFNLLQRKTVAENISLPLEVWGYGKKEKVYSEDGEIELTSKEAIAERVENLLKLVGLEDKKDMKPSNLSGGQKQRVAIARALALEPKILLCDEATSALDPKTTNDILALLEKINKELGITIVVVTHQMEVIKQICENIVLIEGGEIKTKGKAQELFLNPGLSLKKFLGEDDEETLPEVGVNIRIFFPSDLSENSLITKMARELNIDFSIVWGKLEKFKEDVLGSLVINIEEKDKNKVFKYLKEKEVLWEVL